MTFFSPVHEVFRRNHGSQPLARARPALRADILAKQLALVQQQLVIAPVNIEGSRRSVNGSKRRFGSSQGSGSHCGSHSRAEEVADVHEASASLEHARLLRGFLRAKQWMRHRPGSVLASVQLAEHRARHAVGLVRAANPRVAIRPARRRAPPRRPAIGVAERARGRPAPGGGEREAPSTPSDPRRGVARLGARPHVAGAVRAVHAGGYRRA